MKRRAWLVVGLAMGAALSADAAEKAPKQPLPATAGWSYTELRRYKAPEAGQGVAVDREFFYAVNNHTIGKYRKDSGERVALWEGGKGGEIIHLNSASVVDGRLYTVH